MTLTPANELSVTKLLNYKEEEPSLFAKENVVHQNTYRLRIGFCNDT